MTTKQLARQVKASVSMWRLITPANICHKLRIDWPKNITHIQRCHHTIQLLVIWVFFPFCIPVQTRCRCLCWKHMWIYAHSFWCPSRTQWVSMILRCGIRATVTLQPFLNPHTSSNSFRDIFQHIAHTLNSYRTKNSDAGWVGVSSTK